MTRTTRNAFTIVELLVVIGIIGILIAILLPSLSAVGIQGKKTQTAALMTSISAGLEAYRNSTGEPYPPSRSDGTPNAQRGHLTVVDPYFPSGGVERRDVTGATMLVWAMAGADLLGTAGFRDIDGTNQWSDDTHTSSVAGDGAGADGLYALDDTNNLAALRRRHGPFVDVNKGQITTMGDFQADVMQDYDGMLPTGGDNGGLVYFQKQHVFRDGFGFPVLYYRAAKGAPTMVTQIDGVGVDQIGIYTQADNALFTGGHNSLFTGTPFGLDLGAGLSHELEYSGGALPPQFDDDGDDVPDVEESDPDSFAEFILDRSVTVRNTPVNADSYILISAGPDALWGTEDDITNFKR
jgi:prepilin-type N-terminal cleavage/methylation domain-containing protein